MSINTFRFFTGLFLLLLGIAGVSPNIGESIFSLNNNNLAMEIIFGIVEIICGLVIFLGLFVKAQNKTVYNASMVVFLFWIARIVLTKFFWGNPPAISSASFFTWSLILCTELIIASALWLLTRTYKTIR
jgi:hypothetical protein